MGIPANNNTHRAIETNIDMWFNGSDLSDGVITRRDLDTLDGLIGDHLRGYRGNTIVNDVLSDSGYSYTDNNLVELREVVDFYLEEFNDPDSNGMSVGEAPKHDNPE